MFDLRALPAHYVGTYGLPKVAEVCGQSLAVVSMWHKRSTFPLDAVAKLLDFDPAPLGAVTPLYPENKVGAKLAILMPCSGKPEPETMETILRLYDKTEMVFKRVNFNNLPIARNCLAAWWYGQNIPWAFWADADNVFPCGDAELFRRLTDNPNLPEAFAALHTIYRLLVHKKSLVSVCYVGRSKGAPPQFMVRDGVAIREKVKGGPRNELLPVEACGFGGLLMNRQVITDIIAQQADEIRHKEPILKQRFGYEYSLFDPTTKETPGDDFPFAVRAKRAGHQVFVDLAVMAGHVGSKVYTFADL